NCGNKTDETQWVAEPATAASFKKACPVELIEVKCVCDYRRLSRDRMRAWRICHGTRPFCDSLSAGRSCDHWWSRTRWPVDRNAFASVEDHHGQVAWCFRRFSLQQANVS